MTTRGGRASRGIGACLCLALGLVLPACGGGGGSDAESQRRGPYVKTAWQKVLDGIQPDGTVPLDTALQAFSLAFGKLPGVDVPNGKRGTIYSGTLALRSLEQHWAELTPEQQERARELVPTAGPPPSSAEPVASTRSSLLGPQLQCGQDGPGAEPYRNLVDAAVAAIAQHLPAAPAIPKPTIQVNNFDFPDEGIFTSEGCSEAPTSCLISVYESGQAIPVGPKRKAIITHEVFHCYQLFVNPAFAPSWITEGAASWVMEELVPGTGLNEGYWGDYLLTPQSPLFGRSYDAIGFYGHLGHASVDVWSVLLPMQTAGSNETAFTLAAGGGAGTTTDWPSGFFRGSVPGKPWNTSGPGITSDKPPVPQITIANDDNDAESVAPVSNTLAEVDLQADFILIDILGDGHLRDAAGDDTVIQGNHGGLYCTLAASECVCPPGSANEGRELGDGRIAKGEAQLAVSGALPGGSFDLTGQSLEDVVKDLCDACTTGTFVSTDFSIDLPAGIGLFGGTGAVLVINADGSFTLDYTPMSALNIGGPGFAGMGTITGTGSGTIEFIEADNATEGQEAGTVNGSGGSSAIITAEAFGQVVTFPVGSGSFTGPYSCPQSQSVPGQKSLKIDLYGGHWTFERTG